MLGFVEINVSELLLFAYIYLKPHNLLEVLWLRMFALSNIHAMSEWNDTV